MSVEEEPLLSLEALLINIGVDPCDIDEENNKRDQLD